jgi:cytidylate kinase
MKWITFSRKMGTNGSEVAKLVAKELEYRFYDTKAINHMAQALGFLESVRGADEKVPSIFQRIFSQKPTVYLERLYSVLYELAKQGNAVFLGRGSHVLFRGVEGALHVRVTASLERRIHTLMEQGLNRDAAARLIHRTDEERGAFVKYAFGVDWEEAERYDLVLNMDKLSVPLAVKTVVSIARSPELAEAPVEAIRSLEAMALASRADAALIEASSAYGVSTSLSVSVVGPGRLRLEGTVESEKRKAEAEAVLKSVQGVISVENAIQLVPLQTSI